jgi:hypothetical protein
MINSGNNPSSTTSNSAGNNSGLVQGTNPALNTSIISKNTIRINKIKEQ